MLINVSRLGHCPQSYTVVNNYVPSVGCGEYGKAHCIDCCA